MNEKPREFYATTVDEALRKAATELGTEPEQLAYEVLDAGSSGFMGIGARDARITIPEQPRSEGEATTAQRSDIENSGMQEEDITETPASETPPTETPRVENEEVLRDIRKYMSALVERMDLDARVEVYDAGEFVAVDVATDQTGLFIGHKGETIDAIQYLLGVAVYKDRGFWKRLVIDSEGYRQRRIEAVQGIANRMARRAVREQRTVELPPMNAAERRIVHLYLKENDHVITKSEGEGERRRVRVSPA